MRALLPSEQPNQAWRMAGLLLVIMLFSIGVVWWKGTRFRVNAHHSSLSALTLHYAVEGIHAELYDTGQQFKSVDHVDDSSATRQLHVDASHLEALNEAGTVWVLTKPVFTAYESDGRHMTVTSSTAQWNNDLQEGFFPVQVDAFYEQPHQPVAHLRSRKIVWYARQKIIKTDQPFVLEYGAQTLRAVGLRWELASGRIELKSQIHWQGNGAV